MRARTLLVWIAVGLVGLALAAGVTYAATQLSSQRIGLSAEPPSAGEELAPPGARGHGRSGAPAQPHTTTGGATVPHDRGSGGAEQPRRGGGDLDD